MTTETNAVRIQKIKMRSEGLLKYERDYGSDDVNITPIVKDLEWLIEQAELIETYEKSIKGYALAVEIYSDMPVKEAMKKLTELAKQEFDESDGPNEY